MNRFALGAVAAVSLAATLAGCSSSTPAPAASTPPAATTPAAAPTSAPVAPSAPGSAPASAPASAPIAINKEIDDPVLGVKVTIIQAVRGFKPLAPALAGREMIVIQVKVDATQAKYALTVGDSTFNYSTGANKYGGQNATGDAETVAWMKANGYEPLVAAKSGTTQTGWVAGIFNPAGDPAPVINYYQLAFKDNKGATFPEKNYPVTIK